MRYDMDDLQIHCYIRSLCYESRLLGDGALLLALELALEFDLDVARLNQFLGLDLLSRWRDCDDGEGSIVGDDIDAGLDLERVFLLSELSRDCCLLT